MYKFLVVVICVALLSTNVWAQAEDGPVPTPVAGEVEDTTHVEVVGTLATSSHDPDLFYLKCSGKVWGSIDIHPSRNKMWIYYWGIDKDAGMVRYGRVIFETTPKTSLRITWLGRAPKDCKLSVFKFYRADGMDAQYHTMKLTPTTFVRRWHIKVEDKKTP